ncbi:MAG: phosphatase PAP2 family protein [Solobacterium sp.]|nr:phosphatase PAP2 family protein [Solobacterium sp.]
MEWEIQIIEWLQSNIGSLGVSLGKLMAFIGNEKGLLIVILGIMFCYKKETGKKMAVIITTMLTWLAMIKTMVRRPRPYMEYPDRVKILAKVETEAAADNVAAQGYSFPSMHSASVVALYFTLAKAVNKKWVWVLAYVLTVLVALSRILVGAHYPTDVISGLMLGALSIFIYGAMEKYVLKEWLRTFIFLLTALPGLFFVKTNDYYTSLGLLIALTLAIPFEEKYVKYEDTNLILAKVLRLLGALVVYFVLNALLKLPFDPSFLENGSFMALLVRTCRYAIVMFVVLGVYPFLFPLYEKIGKK